MKRRRIKFVTSLLILITLVVSICSSAYAVTGNTVASDGVYTSSLTAYKYKYGKLDKTYTGALNVAVSNGEISGLWVSNASSDKMSKLITNEIYYTYVGSTASASAVSSANGTDSVSSASVSGSTNAVDSTVKKQYVADIQGAIITALGKASAATNTSSETASVVKTVQGTASVSDAEGSKIVLDVGLDASGKIVSLTANNASVSDWSSILSKVSADYLGKTKDEVDAISGATQYTTAVNTAVLQALEKNNTSATEDHDTGTVPSTDSGKTISHDESATIAVGETITLDGTHNSMASSESWSSSNPSVATVVASGGSYDSDAIVTGVTAGTVTITHTINTLFGSSTEAFTVTVIGSDSSSGAGNSGGSGGSDEVSGVTSIQVKKEWVGDAEADRPASVTVGIYNGTSKVQTLTLQASNNWTATASGLDAAAKYTVAEDRVDGYTSSITQGENSGGSGSSGWAAQSYGDVEAGKIYAFTYTSNGMTYLLGRSGTSVIGTTSGMIGGIPNANIGNDYKWEISKATSGTGYGEWLAKNLGNNYYLAPYKGYSTGYSNSAVLQSSDSYYGNVNLHFDDDGSIWNGYGELNLYANGSTVKSDDSSFTVFTPYLYSESNAAGQTAYYTITNTRDDSGSGSGSGGSGAGGKEEDPDEPAHVKAISPDGKVAEAYTLTLNVTGQSKTTTSTSQSGETTTSPYDVLLVLDNTRSMTSDYGNTTRLAAMKSAAQSFVNGLPAADGSKIAMVSFTTGNYNSIVTTDVSWTNLTTGRSTVVSKISALNAPDTGYDTYFTQPLERASSLLDSVANDENKKFVVFFTDGAAAESASTIQSLASAVMGKANATFSIGIVSGSAETQKAQALASDSTNYYDVTTAGTMGSAFANTLSTIQSQTTVTKVPMTGVAIEDTLSNYVELVDASAELYGISLSASPEDDAVSIDRVNVDDKKVTILLSGELTDGTVYTVSIPVKPSEMAQEEANGNEDAVSSFVSNAGATLTYQYGTEDAKHVDYKEAPKILVAKEVTLTYDANGGEDEVIGMPDPLSETKKFADADAENIEFEITNATPSREGHTFLGWADSATATTAAYEAGDDLEMSADKTIYAVWRQDYRLIFEDYTKGGVTISGVETEALVDHESCKIGTTYVNGDVKFTLSADMAVVAAIHTDAEGMSFEKLMDQNGDYNRLYCTDGHQFTVNNSNGDVYVVLAYKGDINLDSRILTKDASLAAMAVTGKTTLTNLQKLVGDVDVDGRNLTKDASACAIAVTGKTTHKWDVAN